MQLSNFKHVQRQRGGTISGFILGVLVGLLIALGLVIYVTKVPIPFLNKSVNRTAEQDAAEEKKNKDWDPNAPLYNKVTNKPVPPANPGEAVSAPGTSGAVNPAKGDDSAQSSSERAGSSTVDLIGDLIRSRTQSEPSTDSQIASTAPPPNAVGTPSAQDPISFYVQAGAFRSPEEAESQRAKLTMLGYDPKVSDKEQGGRTVYRVRIGPLSSKEEAERIQLKLSSSKVEAAILRVQR